MSVTHEVAAPRESVWEVLADGWRYTNWVVGATRIRAVQPEWPATGTRICHSVGVWPLVIDDETRVEKCVPREELVLRAKIWPVGEARVTLRLSDAPGGCRIEMSEVAVAGLMKALPEAVQQAAFDPRNKECLWRLANIAEQRHPGEVD